MTWLINTSCFGFMALVWKMQWFIIFEYPLLFVNSIALFLMHRSKCHLKNKLTNMQYRIKILSRVLMFGKPECDVLQPEPHSGEACYTLSHKSLTNVNIQK